MAVSYTGRDTDAPAGTSTDDETVQVSAGYGFDFGLAVDVGWRHVEEENVDTDGVGVLLAYTIGF